MNLEQHLAELTEEGITLVPHSYTQQECQEYIQIFEQIIEKFKKEKRPLDPQCQIIENPFRHEPRLSKLICHDVIETLLSKLLDEDFVLINSNVINRRFREDITPGGVNIGETWHNDSRYLRGKRLEQGFSYIVCTMFSDFSLGNGGTQYVPKSHLRRDRPERHAPYSFKTIEGKAGTMAIFDTGLWHRGGEATAKDRWSMCSYYGPWFVKPYYRFPEMLGRERGETLTPTLRRLFHYHSTPPLHEDERRNTLTKEETNGQR